MESIEFQARDGFALRGRLYGHPERCRSALLVVPAMGVPQRFYADFADYMAQRDVAVFSFDYRGMGESRPAALQHSLRGLEADVTIWAEQDTAAALAWLAGRVGPDTPVHWIGHSLGGQIFGMVPNRARVSRVVTIGVGTGYWRHQSVKVQAYVWWLWFVVTPLATRICGYFPGSSLRKVGDLPQGVMRQWRRWCLNPAYLVGAGGDGVRADYAALRTPMLSLSFTDDEYMSSRNTDEMHAFYASAPRDMRRIDPKQLGVERIGHFGFFRKRFAPTLWPQVAAWLTPEPNGAAAAVPR